MELQFKYNSIRLRELMAAKSVKQTELAKHLGVTSSAISHMLKEEYIRTDTLEKIAEYLGIPSFELFTMDKETWDILSLKSELKKAQDQIIRLEEMIEIQKKYINTLESIKELIDLKGTWQDMMQEMIIRVYQTIQKEQKIKPIVNPK